MLPTAIVGGGTKAGFDGTLVDAAVDAASLDVRALGENTADANATIANVSFIGGGSGATAKAEITSAADVEALVGSTASITTTGAVLVDARLQGEKNHANARAEGGTGSIFAAVSVMLAQANVDGGVAAALDGDVLGSSQITVQADGANNAEAHTLAVSIGAFAGAGAGSNATVTEDADVEARVGATASLTTSGALKVEADGDNDASAESDMGSGGVVGVAGGSLFAIVGGGVKAELDGDVLDADSVTVDADGSNDAIAHAKAVAVGLVAGSGASAYSEVTDQADVEALVGSTASLTVPGGAVQVLATGDNNAVADGLGGSVSGVSVDVALQTAKVGGGTKAAFDGTLVDAASLDVKALAENTADANVVVFNVSIVGGGAGATANAEITSAADVEALVGSTASIATSGAVLVDARLQGQGNHANARAEGGSGGVLANVAIMLADAKVGGGVAAALDGDVLASSQITVQAFGGTTVGGAPVAGNKAEAHTTAATFSGAFAGAGAGSKAEVTQDADVEARVGATASLTASGALKVQADGDNKATSESDMGSGSILVGATGGSLSAIVSGGVKAELNGDVFDATSVAVVANGSNDARADALAIAIGLVASGAGANAYAEVTNLADVEALVGTTAEMTVPGASVGVQATGFNTAWAQSNGGSGSIGISITAMLPTANVGGGVKAQFSGTLVDATVDAASLDVKALGENSATAKVKVASIGLLAGGAGANATAAITADADVEASIGALAKIATTGAITVDAKSSQSAYGEARGGAGGVVGVAGMLAGTSVKGSTSARIGDGAVIGTAGSVAVHAESLGSTANSSTVAGTGGLVSVGVTRAAAENQTSVDASVGDNVKITTRANAAQNGDIDIHAIGRAEADADALAAGGGGVQVGVANASSVVRPTITANVGGGAQFLAAGDIGVTAELTKVPTGTAPSDAIKSVNLDAGTLGFTYALPTGSVVRYVAPDNSAIGGLVSGREYNVLNVVPGTTIRLGNAFDAAGAVNAVNDTITFSSPHNFKSGDAVFYDAAGGLSIVQPWQTSLPSDDPSYVDLSKVLYVRGIEIGPRNPNTPNVPGPIDPFTIKLVRTYADAIATDASLLKNFDAATQVNAVTDRITISGQNFENGQAVTYRAPAAAQFASNQVDVVVNATTITAPDGSTYASQEFVHSDNNIIYLAGHSFSTGDAVTYHTVGSGPSIGGLNDGQTYYVIKVDADRIRLADSYLHAVGLAFDAQGSGMADDVLAVPQTALQISVVPDAVTASMTFARNNAGDTITRSSGSWLADGFKVGDAITVSGTTNNNGTFTIAGVDATTLTLTLKNAVVVGTVTATVRDTDHTNTHSLARNLKGLEDGVTYYVVDSNKTDGTFGLAATRGGSAIQIDARDDVVIFRRDGGVARTDHPVTRGGTHHVGTTGIDLQAGAGTQTLYIALTSQPASLAGQQLLGAGGVPLNSISPPSGDGLSGASARGGSGGVGDFAFPAAALTASPNVTASFAGGQSSIVAAGSVSIVSSAEIGVRSYGDTAGGGGISIGEAHADTVMTGLDQNGNPTNTPVSTLAQVGDGVSITAGGNFELTADSDHDVAAVARSAGGGIISGKIAETTSKLNYATKAVVGAGASVVSDKAVLIHSTSQITGYTDSYTLSIGIGAGADSDNTNDDRGVRVNALTQINVGAGALVSGRTVDIDANVAKIDAVANARAEAYNPILLGVATAFANALVQVDSNANVLIAGNLNGGRFTEIRGTRGVDIQAHQAKNEVERNASQIAVALIPPQNHFAEGNTNQNASVNADAGAVVYASPRDTSPALLAGTGLETRAGFNLALFVEAGLGSEDGVASKVRNIEWDADVVIAPGPNPELIVDQAGDVVRADNITVNGVKNPSVGTHLTGSVTVGPIYNNGDDGDIVFEAKATNTGDGTITQQSNEVTNGHFWGTFFFRDNFGEVRITNESALDLIIDSIDLVHSASQPKVLLDTTPPNENENGGPDATGGKTVTMRFDLVHSPVPALIDIKNLNKHATAATDPSDIILIGTGIFAGAAGFENPAGETRILTTRGNIITNPDVIIRTRTLGDPAARVLPKDFERIADGQFTGSVEFATNGASPDSIRRIDGGDWTSLGFVVGDLIKVSDDPANRTVYQIAAIGGPGNSVLTLNTLAAVGPGLATVTVTRFHGIEATTGNIGSAQQRIRVELVQSVVGNEALFAEAGNDLFLDIQGRLREDIGGQQFQVNLNFIGAGRDADVVMRASVEETEAPGSGSVLVSVPSEQGFFDGTNNVPAYHAFTSFFRPDGGQPAGIVDPAPPRRTFFVSTAEGIDSTFDFGLIEAGSHIRITALDSTPPDSDTRLINVLANTNIKPGGEFIDITTNGFIGTLARPVNEIVAVDPLDSNDLRVGTIRSTSDQVFLFAPNSILDAASEDDATVAADVGGVSITMRAQAGSIGTTAEFLETNLIDSIDSGIRAGAQSGTLTANALQGIYVNEIAGDLRLNMVDSTQSDVSLVTWAGSIIDGRLGAGSITDDAVIVANSIDLQARGGSIGQASGGGGDIEIDSSRQATGDVGLEATNDIYLTEVANTLRLVQARTPTSPNTAGGGNIRLKVRESKVPTSLQENLDLLASGSVLFDENAPRAVPNGFIHAGGWVELRIGDDLIDHVNTTISAGDRIDIYLDDLNNGSADGDPGYGANTTLVGTITPGSGKVASIFGFTDVDRITFDQTTLGGYTRVYGSNAKTTAGGTAPLGDGEDIFTVNKLQSMPVGTLTLDGQAGSDHYIINTSGSQGANRNYIINALDTGASDDGVDVLSVYGVDTSDDIFLLRGMTAIAGLNGSETADRPAFVGLLHGSLAQAQAGTSTAVERINYDSAINGRLEVFGLAGNDSFATDDNSAITTLDGGLGDDSFQIGQLYGTRRNTSASLDANDVFATVATTRGWLSKGNTSALVAEGGAGNDQFTVYSNQAVLRLEGNDGNDSFVIRAFALADTVGGTEGATKTYQDGGETKIATFHDGIWWRTYDAADPSKSVALPALTSGFSTAAETAVRTGAGENQVQYNINAPVSIDGGSGFDKVVVLGTEFADHIVVTDKAVYGAGLAVSYQNIEVLEIDGLEGDDSFDVLSTPPGVLTRVIGGLGSDVINVGGDVIGTVFAQDVEGSSGAINHLVTSGDVRYNGMVIDGVDLSVARPTQGVVIITESAGFTAVTEGVGFETYTVALQHASTEDVYVTVSAAASLLDEQKLGADSIWVSENSADFFRHFTDNYVTGAQPTSVPKRSIVLHFAPGETAAKTVYVMAPTDGVAEGDRTVAISHSVISKDALFDNARVRNVEVDVYDVDQPAINLIAIDPATGTADNQSIVLEGDATTRIADQYKVHLAIPPAAGTTVTIDISVGDARLALSSADARFSTITAPFGTTPGVYRITFSAADASDVLVTLTAVNDVAPQDPHTTVVTHKINAAMTTDSRYDNAITGATPQSLYVKVLDNDTAGVVVAPSNGSTVVNASDTSQTDSYTLRLTTAPTADVKISILTDGQTNVLLDSRVQLAAIGTPQHGLYSGAITWDAATRTLTRNDGSSWLDDGFLEGQLVRFNGAISGDVYKIQLIHGSASGKLDQLTLTPTGALSLSSGAVTVTQWAPQVTFTAANWWQAVTVRVGADPAFALQPGAEDVKVFAKRPHLLGGLQGPLQVEGGTTSADRSLRKALLLPGETNGPLFGIGPQPSEATQIDVLNVYTDSSVENLVGAMTSTTITGLNMSTGLDFGAHGFTATASGESLVVPGGISFGTISIDSSGKFVTDAGFSTIEVVNLMLGEGNDTFTVSSTLKPGADLSTGIPALHGGITAIHGGGNSLLQVSDAFGVARVDGGANTQVTRTDGLAWASYGFAVGQTILYDGVLAGIITSLNGSAMTVGGVAVAPNPTNSTHTLGVYDPKGHEANRVPDPYSAASVVDTDMTRVGGDTIVINGGGGPDSPLVVYGDTSQDGVWYQGDPTHMSAHDFGPKPWGTQIGNGAPNFIFAQAGFFHWFGNDVIDARLNPGTNPDGSLKAIGINAFGGGGDDTIYGSQTGDRLTGGAGDDTIEGQRGVDLIYGDSGINVNLITRDLSVPTVDLSTFITRDKLVAGRDVLFGNTGTDIIFGDHGIVTQSPGILPILTTGNVIRIESTQPVNGAPDQIDGGSENDLIMGGAGGDVISGGAANDLIFGDHGLVFATNAPAIDLNALPLSDFAPNYPFAFQSIFIGPDAGGAGDVIYGDAVVEAASDGDDIILGGQGSDTVYGGGGDDDIIGGHNVSGGFDTGDRLDGQSGNDVIAGDNAIILRRGDAISPRIRLLSDVSIYDANGVAQVTDTPQANPTGVEARNITILDHSVGASVNTFGDDYIAGGADDDVIFGQLGDDIIQGDGSIGPVSAPNHVSASVDSDGRLVVVASVEGGKDGDDYIEGGGGNDVIFGNLGQDDIVGGSSSLYEGLKLVSQRPDGSDILFGGAGTPATIAANALGRGAVVGDADGTGHAYDADVILGDNGNILRLVGVNGQVGNGGVNGVGTFRGFLAFNYDNYTDAAPAVAQLKIIPRAYQLLDYTPGGSPSDIGASDIVHGGDSDDIIHGMTGNDVLYGDGYDDDIYGGVGHDKIFGGSGEDGIVGDDGILLTSRNGLIEPLNQLTVANQQTLIETNDPFTGAVVDITGILKKDVVLQAYELGGHDVIYGGLGDDWIHAGAGDDAISGAEALENADPVLDFFNNVTPLTDLAPITYDPATRILTTFRLFDASGNIAYEATAYDANNPRDKIANFFLNFASFDQAGVLIEDGKDRLFGDLGNDWVVGGTGHDRLFGGMGDDYLQLDDNLETSGTDDANIPQVTAGGADFAYGGGGLDVLIANSGFDRMYDWTGEFNSFITPFARFGQPTVERRPQPATVEFLLALGREGGADQSRTEPGGELGLVTQKDPEWNDQHGGPRDPQPGHGKDFYDGDGDKENDSQVLLTEHGSTPTGRRSLTPPPPLVDGIVVEKAGNAAVELAPTTAEDADTAPGQVLVVGTNVVWTYLVRNTGTSDLVNVVVRDDAGTPGDASDDFIAVAKRSNGFVIGDTDQDDVLDPGETWLFTSAGVVTHQVHQGSYTNIATATAQNDRTAATVSDSDPYHYTGVLVPPPAIDGIVVEKAGNAVDPLHPTTAEDADAAPGQLLAVGTPVVWTYLVRNTGTSDLTNVVVRDDAGTPGTPGDDFFAIPKLSNGFVIGDTDHDNVLDPGETWLFTSAGVAVHLAKQGSYANIATVTATSVQNAVTVRDEDPYHYTGVLQPPPPLVDGLVVQKAGNAAVELAPTTAEDADTAPGQVMVVGTSVVWTYLVRNTGATDLTNVVVRDDAGTPNDASDDFIAVAKLSNGFVIGDTDQDNVLDPGETWLFTSAGVVTHLAKEGTHGNIATATATSVQNAVTVSDEDPYFYTGVRVIQPPPIDGIVVEKAGNAVDPLHPTTAEDADTAPGQLLTVGSPVVWTYLVRNTGETGLVNVVVRDDAGTPGVAGDDFVAVAKLSNGFVVGDTDQDTVLDPGETWLFTSAGVVTHLVKQGAYANVATVTATSVENAVTVSDTDPYHYTGVAVPPPPVDGIVVEKAGNAVDPLHPTAAEDADTAPGPSLLVGTPVVWTYLVRNTGATDLVSVVVRDDAGTPGDTSDDFIAVARLSNGFVIGDTDQDNVLDPGETWLFTSAGVVTYLAKEGPYANLATVTATSVQNAVTVTDDDPYHYTGVLVPPPPPVDAIVVEKAGNAVDPLHPTTAEDADTAPGQSLLVGTPVVWTYLVRNTGTSDLINVVVSDDAGTARSNDDFNPVAVLTARGFVVGDVDEDQILDPGETWLFTSEGVTTHVVRKGSYENIATVTAQSVQNAVAVSDTDPYNYTGVVNPPPPLADAIVVEKAGNAVDPLHPTAAEDADTAPGQSLLVGTPVVWTYLVSNTGQTDLINVVVRDDAGTPGDTSDDFTAVAKLSNGFVIGDTDQDNVLDPGETWLFTSAGVVTHLVQQGAYANLATVTAKSVQNAVTVSDDDPYHYTGVLVPPPPPVDGIVVEKAGNAVDPLHPTTAEDADTAPGQLLAVGTPVVWTYLVRNTGTSDLVNVVIRDDAGTPSDATDDFIAVAKLSNGFVVGDTNKDNILDPGETWLFTSAGVVTHLVKEGAYANVATVTAQSVQNSVTVRDEDPYNYTGVVARPAVSIVKTAHIEGDADQVIDSTADDIAYTITVTNNGNVNLTNVTLEDVIAGYQSQSLGTPTSHPAWVQIAEIGGIAGNDTLEAGESWIYTFVHDVTQADIDSHAVDDFQLGGVPAQFPNGGANGSLFFSGTDLPATGSGVIDPFVRIQAKDTEQGYNTDARPYDATNDAGATATFNHSIQLSDIPVVEINGVRYREFRLDINEANIGGKTNLISLEALKLFSADAGNLSGLDTTVGTVGATNAFSSGRSRLLYNLDSAGDIRVILTDWSTGSGHGDYAVLIPDAAFAGVAENQFIYLYSAFGDSDGTNGGFEEWYVRKPASIDNTATVTASAVALSGETVRVRDSDTASVALVQTVAAAGAVTADSVAMVNSAATASPALTTNPPATTPVAAEMSATVVAAGAVNVTESISTAKGSNAGGLTATSATPVLGVDSAVNTSASNTTTAQASASEPNAGQPAGGGASVSPAAGTASATSATVAPNQPAAQTSKSSAQTSPAPTIDWSKPIEVTSSQAPSPASSPVWVDDFVNYLGQSEKQRNPNAAIKVRPTSTSVPNHA